METEFGVQMPRALRVEFSGAVQKISDSSGEEQTPEDIWKAFDQECPVRKHPTNSLNIKHAPVVMRRKSV